MLKQFFVVLGTLSVLSMTIITPHASAVSGVLNAPLASSNSSFTYCTIPNNAGESFAINDVNGSRQILNNKAYFFVIKNDYLNVINGRCVGFKQWTFAPYIAGHITKFDLDNVGLPINVTISNSLPSFDSVTCEGNDTVLRFLDGQEDKLSLVSISGNNDFDFSTSNNESRNALKVKLSSKNYDFSGTNKISFYVSEEIDSDRGYGFVPFVNGVFQNPAVSGQADLTTKSQVSRYDVSVNSKCNSTTNSKYNNSSTLLWKNNYDGNVVKWNVNANQSQNIGIVAQTNSSNTLSTINNFGGKNNSDVLVRATNGDLVLWTMNANGQKSDETYITNIDPVWKVVGSADFNKDGKSDILWRNSNTGENVIWYMNGAKYISQTQIMTIPTEFYVGGVADFNKDGNPDILWRKSKTGENVIYYMNNSSFLSEKIIERVGAEWTISGISDFNNDGNPDLFYRNNYSGENIIWYTNNGDKIGYNNLNNVNNNWSLVVGK